MYLFRHILFRKIIAGFLLCILSFIYAEKIFHTHEKNLRVKQYAGISLFVKNNTCAICDFQVAGNAEIPSQLTIEVPVIFGIGQATSAPDFYQCTVLSSITGRGPPAC